MPVESTDVKYAYAFQLGENSSCIEAKEEVYPINIGTAEHSASWSCPSQIVTIIPLDASTSALDYEPHDAIPVAHDVGHFALRLHGDEKTTFASAHPVVFPPQNPK